MADPKLLFCILLISFCTVSLGQMALDCCLSVTNKTIDKKLVGNYLEQAKGCSLPATILVTRRGKNLCAPLDDPWVQKIKTHVNHLKKFCKKNNYQGKRCFGVTRE